MKSRIEKLSIYLGFSFLKKRKKLLIAAPIEVAIASISSATIFEVLSIDNYIQKPQCLVKGLWQNHLALILDEISTVSLKLLLTVDMCLNQAKNKTNNNTAVLGSLTFIIVKENFYKFPSIVGKSLWTYPITNKKIKGKDI